MQGDPERVEDARSIDGGDAPPSDATVGRTRTPRPPVRSFVGAMAAVFVLALTVRVGAVSFVPDGTNCPACMIGMPIMEGVGGDGAHYLFAGRALSGGRGFVVPMATEDVPYAHQPPLWTLVMAATDEIGLETVREKKLLFALLGAGTAVLVGLATHQVASERASVIAASIAAVYPGFWLYERNFNSETIAFPLIAAVLILAYRYRRRPGWGRALLLGAAVALLCTARTEQVLVIPLLLVPVLVSTPSVRWRTRVARVAACGAIIVATLSPWTIYNLGRFERPVLLSTGFGFTALVGACDTTFHGERLGGSDAWTCLVTSPSTREKDPSVADGLMRQAAFDYTVHHLDRLPVVAIAREGRSWGFYEPAQQVRFNGQALNAPPGATWTQVVAYWIVFACAAAGVVVLRRRRIPIYPLLTFPVIVVVTTLVTFGDSRYRATAEVSLVVFAANAIDALWSRLRSPSPGKDARPSGIPDDALAGPAGAKAASAGTTS